ncbi:S-adenosyl-L-methionine-dependent methyltransferase [Eremomyces bilateralis CBS 781.70]|uniref:S-adenosyl-L-methionine-dependent methyltransferase n=1 Tax=Eremomyces bilateralis CBS 781.70 TaxID=1392243 RepID=A0A6G1GC13_9PEZI|nr:S-adenosyl-L-methionine-dependent methyltransferase [Eremomyces bilateralis CBS 781.70]KAF1815476.1 S-adenosyl-L-methionine-dependent methyltransferase [Eremomyces bilateralis CBS 781.70]
MSRPEDILPPDIYYSSTTARKYTTSSRIQHIQAQMAQRALSLLNLTTPSYILDVGCGSGLSGAILSSTPPEAGGPHVWVGMDISADMLSVALERGGEDPDTGNSDDGSEEGEGEEECQGDLFLADAGQGVPFRAGTFDAAISISAVQWLCNAESSIETAEGRLKRFFEGLYAALRRGGRAVCQFYPRDEGQKRMVAQAAIRAGFGAGLLEDGAGTKAVKVYLVCTVGGGDVAGGDITGVVEGMEGVEVDDTRRRVRRGGEKGMQKGSKQWILRKKDRMERKGMVVKATSKYTGRKRKIAF